MKRAVCAVAVAGIVLALAGTSAGQGGTTATLNGIVVDMTGAMVPGADVVAKHNATGATVSAISNSGGVFSFPALNTGTYTVTVSLQGFKTYVASNGVPMWGAG